MTIDAIRKAAVERETGRLRPGQSIDFAVDSADLWNRLVRCQPYKNAKACWLVGNKPAMFFSVILHKPDSAGVTTWGVKMLYTDCNGKALDPPMVDVHADLTDWYVLRNSKWLFGSFMNSQTLEC